MPHLIDPDDLAALLDSDVDAGRLALELAAAENAIELSAGPVGEVREFHRGGAGVIILRRFAASVRAIREPYEDEDLVDGVWRLDADRRSLWRLDTSGTPIGWAAGDVSVYYQPADDLALRQAAALALIRHSLSGIPGVLGFSEGNFSIQFKNGETWSSAQADVMGSLERPWSFA